MLRSATCRLSGIAILIALTASVALADDHSPAADSLIAEAQRRHDELVKQGFSFTSQISTGGAAAKVDLLVPPSNDEHVISLWFETAQGELAIRLVSPSGEVLAAWKGRKGELQLTRTLPPGRYALDVTPSGGGRPRGIVGVKGPVVTQCRVDPARLTEHAAQPDRGFHWPYLLVTPTASTAKQNASTLLVLPNNTGFATEDLELLRAGATCQLANTLAFADQLGTPILVPMFPRPPAGDDNLYLHALSRESLMVKTPAVARVDLQLIAMIDDARAALAKSGTEARPRVLISGFSAAGMFANRFAVLHPDRTLAAAVGSPGGWPLAPTATDGRDILPYPVGIADVTTLTGAAIDLATLKQVAFFFFIGNEDKNDSVVFRDSFSSSDEALVMRRFGKTPVTRWKDAQRLYGQTGLQAKFKLYPRAGHEVTQDMKADIEATFRAAMASER
jgi:hypothetical protein